ncbi:MAG: Maf-like protein YhdE [Chloroflexi bacterium]|nr:Maf-like protein YhdE [Chloroflexota bacterium]
MLGMGNSGQRHLEKYLSDKKGSKPIELVDMSQVCQANSPNLVGLLPGGKWLDLYIELLQEREVYVARSKLCVRISPRRIHAPLACKIRLRGLEFEPTTYKWITFMKQITNSYADYAFILASNSPRRRQLLSLVVDDFQVQPADVDESLLAQEAPPEYVLRLAENKAQAVGESVNGHTLVVAADTTVVDEGQVLGKPANAEDARLILRRLRGRTHQVLTGLAVFHPFDASLVSKLVTTDVLMRTYTDQEIEDYIASGDPFDKAGAYAIQNEEFSPVPDLGGCFANVMGFPICDFMLVLERFGILLKEEVPLKCQAALGYDCPIYEQVIKVKRDV